MHIYNFYYCYYYYYYYYCMHSIIIYILFIHFHFYSLFVYYYLCHYYYYYYYFYFLFLFLFYLFTYLIENCWNCLDLKDAYDPLCWRTKLYNLVSPSSLPLILKSCFILLFPLVSFSFLLIFFFFFILFCMRSTGISREGSEAPRHC